MRTRTSRLFTTALTVVLTVGSVAMGANGTAVAAEVPPGVTVPAELVRNAAGAGISAVGETGYLRGRWDVGYSWVSYADGRVLPYDDRGAFAIFSTGSDTVAHWYWHNGARIVLRNVHSGAEATIAIPEGQSFEHMSGERVVTTESGAAAMHLLSWENGRQVDRRVTGLPEGAKPAPTHGGNEHGVFVEYELPGDSNLRQAWVDPTGQAHLLPKLAYWGYGGLLDDRHVEVMYDGTIRVWDVADWSKPLYELAIPKDQGPRSVPLGVVGDAVLVAQDLDKAGRIIAVPLDGSPARTVLDGVGSFDFVLAGKDGRVLAVRYGEGTDLTAHLFSPAADGALSEAHVEDVPPIPVTVEDLALTQGRLDVIDGSPLHQLRTLDLSVSGPLTVGQQVQRRQFTSSWIEGTGDGRLVSRAGTWELVRHGAIRTEEEPLTGASGPPASDVVGKYAGRRDANNHYVVFDMDTKRGIFDRDVTGREVALAGPSVWIESATRGLVDVVDVRTGVVLRSVDVADCDLTDLQVWGTSVYWQCGTSGGVYDTASRTSTALPAHRSALLGDGYVGWEQAGALSITDVRGTTGTRKIGTPADATPGRGWTVDRFGGHLAYADAQQNIQIVPSGVPTSALSVWDRTVATTVDVKRGTVAWSPRLWTSKPVASWSLALTHQPSGRVVRTLTGGEARGLIGTSWKGTEADGRLAPDGTYTWALTATPADGTAVVRVATGSLVLKGASPRGRDHAGASGLVDGRDDLLVRTTSGSLDFWHGTGTGRVSGKTVGAGWGSSVNSAVPFGDANGDGCNDVLLRMSGGELRTYKPGCGKPLTPAVAYTKAGSGFGAMNVLTSPGDLTGDGRADLIARNGDSLYLYAGKAGGTFAAGVRIGAGWSAFTHIVGTGDLEADGFGDLVARKSDGSLYRYSGAGAGRFKSGVKILSGWGGSYTSVVGVGDLDADGKRDLVARDKAGLLFRISGNGTGSFGAAVQIGSGWGSFAGLY